MHQVATSFAFIEKRFFKLSLTILQVKYSPAAIPLNKMKTIIDQLTAQAKPFNIETEFFQLSWQIDFFHNNVERVLSIYADRSAYQS